MSRRIEMFWNIGKHIRKMHNVKFMIIHAIGTFLMSLSNILSFTILTCYQIYNICRSAWKVLLCFMHTWCSSTCKTVRLMNSWTVRTTAYVTFGYMVKNNRFTQFWINQPVIKINQPFVSNNRLRFLTMTHTFICWYLKQNPNTD